MNNQYQKDNMAVIGMATDGLQLTDAEKKTLEWISTWETSTVQNIVSVIEKVKQKDNNTIASVELRKKGAAVNLKLDKSHPEASANVALTSLVVALADQMALSPDGILECIVAGLAISGFDFHEEIKKFTIGDFQS